MHEMGIAMQIIDIAVASIPQHTPPIRVETVNLKIGKLSAVIPESLRFCFEIASQDTALAGAKLSVEEIPVVALCQNCQNKWEVSDLKFTCQKCDSSDIDIISGRELDIVSLDVEEPKKE